LRTRSLPSCTSVRRSRVPANGSTSRIRHVEPGDARARPESTSVTIAAAPCGFSCTSCPGPTRRLKQPSLPLIPSHVLFELAAPEFYLRARQTIVVRATVPKTAINKYRDLLRREYQIGLAGERTRANAISPTGGPDQLSQDELWTSVRAPNAAHMFGTGKAHCSRLPQLFAQRLPRSNTTQVFIKHDTERPLALCNTILGIHPSQSAGAF
jgi:hypothetical protein